jgi:hypothetical protein
MHTRKVALQNWSVRPIIEAAECTHRHKTLGFTSMHFHLDLKCRFRGDVFCYLL